MQSTLNIFLFHSSRMGKVFSLGCWYGGGRHYKFLTDSFVVTGIYSLTTVSSCPPSILFLIHNTAHPELSDCPHYSCFDSVWQQSAQLVSIAVYFGLEYIWLQTPSVRLLRFCYQSGAIVQCSRQFLFQPPPRPARFCLLALILAALSCDFMTHFFTANFYSFQYNTRRILIKKAVAFKISLKILS